MPTIAFPMRTTVITFPPPPAGFDPLKADQALLLRHAGNGHYRKGQSHERSLEREIHAARSQSCLDFFLIPLFLGFLGAVVLGTPTHSVAFGAAVGAIVGFLLALINAAVVGRRVRAMRRDIDRLGL
jgi:hypothetical protein